MITETESKLAQLVVDLCGIIREHEVGGGLEGLDAIEREAQAIQTQKDAQHGDTVRRLI